jgi:hypothetical protein
MRRLTSMHNVDLRRLTSIYNVEHAQVNFHI